MSKEAMKLEMVDDEGENQAVRMFLALYGGACGVTAEQMRKHLNMAGFDGAWPEWANSHNGHLTKAGAQLWIRHLFALAQPAQPQQEQEPLGEVFINTGFGSMFAPIKDVRWKDGKMPQEGTKLYTSPPAQRKPLPEQPNQDLTDKAVQERLATSWGYVKNES